MGVKLVGAISLGCETSSYQSSNGMFVSDGIPMYEYLDSAHGRLPSIRSFSLQKVQLFLCRFKLLHLLFFKSSL